MASGSGREWEKSENLGTRREKYGTVRLRMLWVADHLLFDDCLDGQ